MHGEVGFSFQLLRTGIPIGITGTHLVNGSSMVPPFAENLEIAYFGMGRSWGAAREFRIAEGYCGMQPTGVACPIGPGVGLDLSAEDAI